MTKSLRRNEPADEQDAGRILQCAAGRAGLQPAGPAHEPGGRQRVNGVSV
jgi:hypothetical protein